MPADATVHVRSASRAAPPQNKEKRTVACAKGPRLVPQLGINVRDFSRRIHGI